MRTSSDVIYLVSCAVNNLIPDRSRVEQMDLDEVYTLAEHHMLKAAVAFALDSAGIKDKRSRDVISRSQRKTVLFANAWEEIKQKLEAANIWYMPLKGQSSRISTRNSACVSFLIMTSFSMLPEKKR